MLNPPMESLAQTLANLMRNRGTTSLNSEEMANFAQCGTGKTELTAEQVVECYREAVSRVQESQTQKAQLTAEVDEVLAKSEPMPIAPQRVPSMAELLNLMKQKRDRINKNIAERVDTLPEGAHPRNDERCCTLDEAQQALTGAIDELENDSAVKILVGQGL